VSAGGGADDLREHGMEGLAQQRSDGQVGVTAAVTQQAHVDRSVRQGAELLGRPHFAQLHFDPGVGAAVLLDGGRQLGKHD
jgi:hypothetical protein